LECRINYNKINYFNIFQNYLGLKIFNSLSKVFPYTLLLYEFCVKAVLCDSEVEVDAPLMLKKLKNPKDA
jgi:hypothetical protein